VPFFPYNPFDAGGFVAEMTVSLLDFSPRVILERRKEALLAERVTVDANLAQVEREILALEGLSIARELGIKINKKTRNKAVAWGSILYIIIKYGCMRTRDIKLHLLPDSTDDQYATLRSHIFRMSIDGFIEKEAGSGRWRLTEKVSQTAAVARRLTSANPAPSPEPAG
jgi:hypothetical protein